MGAIGGCGDFGPDLAPTRTTPDAKDASTPEIVKPDPRSILTIDLREEHEFAALIEAGASTAEGPREQQEGLVGLSLEHGAQD